MFEHKHKRPISQRQFHLRMLKSVGLVLVLTAISLMIGVIGFELTEHYSFIDALLNASMLLGGMGQINPIVTDGGKWFASFYAIYSGLVVLASTGVFLAPILHRVLHKFHAQE